VRVERAQPPHQAVVLAQEERVERDQAQEDGDAVVAAVQRHRAVLGAAAHVAVEGRVVDAAEGRGAQQRALPQPRRVVQRLAVDVRAVDEGRLLVVQLTRPPVFHTLFVSPNVNILLLRLSSNHSIGTFAFVTSRKWVGEWGSYLEQTGAALTKSRQQRPSPAQALLAKDRSCGSVMMGRQRPPCAPSEQDEQESRGSRDERSTSCTRNWPNCMSSVLPRSANAACGDESRSRDSCRAPGRSPRDVPAFANPVFHSTLTPFIYNKKSG